MSQRPTGTAISLTNTGTKLKSGGMRKTNSVSCVMFERELGFWFGCVAFHHSLVLIPFFSFSILDFIILIVTWGTVSYSADAYPLKKTKIKKRIKIIIFRYIY